MLLTRTKIRQAKTRWARGLAIIIIALTASGCAATRSVVSLDQPYGDASNPEHGTAIKITNVIDARSFEAAPKNPSTPSLPDDDINNPSLTARAIGRKRGGFGMAMGDVLLPDGQTVSGIMGAALADSFRKAHYRVLEPGDAGYEKAVPVQARVIQFWSWFQPGFWEVQVHNRAEVEMTGALPALKHDLTVRGQADESMMAVMESDWQSITSEGLKNLSQNLVDKLADRQ